MHRRRALGYVASVPPEYDASRATSALARQIDPSIAALIEAALGDAGTVANFGTGSFESPGREVIAGSASLGDESVDAALSVMTVRDEQGLAELRRVARRRVVLFTFDVAHADDLWLVRDYLPEIGAAYRERFLPIEQQAAAIGGASRIDRVPIPHDCRAGLLGAHWRRPERYLEAANPVFAALPAGVLQRGLEKLRNDLDGGAWRRRYGGLLSRDELDVGYRLVVAEL